MRRWAKMLRVRYARTGLDTYALDGRIARLEELIGALYEYVEKLKEA